MSHGYHDVVEDTVASSYILDITYKYLLSLLSERFLFKILWNLNFVA